MEETEKDRRPNGRRSFFAPQYLRPRSSSLGVCAVKTRSSVMIRSGSSFPLIRSVTAFMSCGPSSGLHSTTQLSLPSSSAVSYTHLFAVTNQCFPHPARPQTCKKTAGGYPPRRFSCLFLSFAVTAHYFPAFQQSPLPSSSGSASSPISASGRRNQNRTPSSMFSTP